jgi:8-oxo-dGTP pyrophosphatase MutT (NUDIX family)
MKYKKDCTVVEAVVILFVRRRAGKEPEVLLGPKTNGPVKGWIIPPGGHLEEIDQGPIDAGHREGREESGLSAVSSYKVAELRVEFPDKNKMVLVHVTMCLQWIGQPKNRKGSGHEWLRFIPFPEIPWDKIPTKEEKWMRLVLFEHRKCVVWITCGKDRRDVRRVTTRTVEGFQ